MTDLIKRLGASCYLAFEDGTNDYSAAQEAIDRIEELEKQCSAYARADQLFVEDINELEAKLTKAVGFLKTMVDYNEYVIAPFLAELEGK